MHSEILNAMDSSWVVSSIATISVIRERRLLKRHDKYRMANVKRDVIAALSLPLQRYKFPEISNYKRKKIKRYPDIILYELLHKRMRCC